MKDVVFSKDALKTLSRAAANVSRLIRAKLDQYAVDPKSLANNITALQGETGVYRLRIGDWRVVFTEDAQAIAVVRIAPRGDAYD